MSTRLLLALVALLAVTAQAHAAAGPVAPPPVVAAVVVRPAVKTSIAVTVTAYGTVLSDPNAVRSLDAPFAARVARVFVRPGSSVAKGDRLVELQSTPAQRAAYDQAKAAVAYAQGELARQQHLLTQQLATHAQVAQARTALADAVSKLHALESVGAGQQQTVLTATTAGVVSTVAAQVGQRLAEGAPILTLAPESALIAKLGVEPENAGAVHPGMKVTLHDVLDPVTKRTGTVVAVSSVVTAATRLRDVVVRLDPPTGAAAATDPPPADGTFVKGTIALRTVQAIAVPDEALLIDQHGTYLFIDRGGIARRVDVTPGAEAGGLTGVTGQVKPGDSVVVQGNYELRDGMHVRMVAQ